MSALTVIMWLRLISYLRIFEQTRTLIRLIVEIAHDIMSFCIVFFLTISGISAAYDLVFASASSEGSTLSDSWCHIYRIAFGDFDTGDYNRAAWALFFFATIFLTLMMLNLLIAIMSNTFARVSASQEISDGKELLEMIYEIETLMFWRRWSWYTESQKTSKRVTNGYLHWAREDTNQDGDWQNMFTNLEILLKPQKGIRSSNLEAEVTASDMKELMEMVKLLTIKVDEVSKKCDQNQNQDSQGVA